MELCRVTYLLFFFRIISHVRLPRWSPGMEEEKKSETEAVWDFFVFNEEGN